jgi:hypothetical protein
MAPNDGTEPVLSPAIDGMYEERSAGGEPNLSTEAHPSSHLVQFLQAKQREWDAVKSRSGPLELLDLPVDILRLIVKEITHTNDLTALALTNSTLHNLAIPHIYARFDIVWPDAHITSSDPKSVDALTYGLSTLCLGSAFARTMQRLRKGSFPQRRFKGNEYAKYTRKFSLGNGPSEWVAEYLVSKESGKMLGTLVALALDKMINLESFVWDMPTGVLSDTFMALGSLPEHHANNECKLEKVWIRWHDNSETSSSATSSVGSTAVPGPSVNPSNHHIHLTPVGVPVHANQITISPKRPKKYSESVVEYPTFSVLPPLRSLTVLNIDELAYLDEMSVLIERSKDKLQELRVGISAKSTRKDFVETWDGPGLQQVDHNARWPGESTIGEKRLGGILGILVGRIYDIRRKSHQKGKESPRPEAAQTDETATLSSGWSYISEPGPEMGEAEGIAQNSSHLAASTTEPRAVSPHPSGGKLKKQKNVVAGGKKLKPSHAPRPRLEGKLKLQTLELERVPLSLQVCMKAIEWTVLTRLTILDCPHHEQLWRVLKKQFQPSPMSSGYGISANSKPAADGAMQYYLNLKRIHTDITSVALVNFLRETLAPNSLEVLFLQDRRKTSASPPVTIDAVFKAVKRHRLSLQQLLLDSSAKKGPNSSPGSPRWKSWMLTTDMLSYVCSGRMTSLRELAVSLHYADWVSRASEHPRHDDYPSPARYTLYLNFAN